MWEAVLASLLAIFVQPAVVEGVAVASPSTLPTGASDEFTARTWKVWAVALVRLPTVADMVDAPLDGTSVHVPG